MFSDGKIPQEVKNHTERRGTEVFPITIDEHIELLENSGFVIENQKFRSVKIPELFL